MRVKISYGADIDEVPEEVEQLFSYVSETNEEAPTAEESGWAMGTRLDEPSMSEILQWGVTPSASDWQSENRAEFK